MWTHGGVCTCVFDCLAMLDPVRSWRCNALPKQPPRTQNQMQTTNPSTHLSNKHQTLKHKFLQPMQRLDLKFSKSETPSEKHGFKNHKCDKHRSWCPPQRSQFGTLCRYSKPGFGGSMALVVVLWWVGWVSKIQIRQINDVPFFVSIVGGK